LSKKNKAKSQVPSINLKGEDFIHTVPADMNLEVIIHWKGQGYQPEYINPVHAFCVQQGEFKVINRNLMDTAYVFDIKEIKAVYLLPMGEM
jgi:hypothetical protein